MARRIRVGKRRPPVSLRPVCLVGLGDVLRANSLCAYLYCPDPEITFYLLVILSTTTPRLKQCSPCHNDKERGKQEGELSTN